MGAISEKKFEEADRLLREARAEDPKDAQAAYYHGVALEGLERPADAELAYARAIELDPKLLEASQNLSALLVESDQAAKALEVADRALGLAPEDAGLLANRALALGALGSPEADAAFGKALEKRPNDGWLRYYHAAVLTLEKNNERAAQELAKIRVEDEALGAQVSDLFGVLKDFPGCVRSLDAALKSLKSTELTVRRGRCKVGAGDMKGAEADFRAAIAVAPSEPIGHFYLGKHLLAQGKRAEGRAELGKARDLGPDTPFGQQAAELLARP